MAKRFIIKIHLSLRRIWGMLVCISLKRFRDKAAIFFTIVLPIVIIFLFCYLFGGVSIEEFDLYYLNEDLDSNFEPYPQVTELLQRLEGNETKETNINLKEAKFNSLEIDPEKWAIDNNCKYLLFIPKGWSRNISAPSLEIKAYVEFYYDPSYTSSLTVLELVDKAVQEMDSQVVNRSVFINLEATTTPKREELTMIDFIVPGVMMISVASPAMMGINFQIRRERESGILYKISSTPLKKWEWLFSLELVQIFLAILSAFISIITGWLVFGFHLSLIHPLMLVIIIFGTMAFLGLGLIISQLVKNPDAAYTATAIFITPQIFLSGAVIPLELMPTYLQYIARIFPLYYITEAMRDLMLRSFSHHSWLNLGITVAMGLGAFIIGSFTTRWKKE